MNEERTAESPSWNNPPGEVMKTPDDVAAMVRLKDVPLGYQAHRPGAGLQPSHGEALRDGGRSDAVQGTAASMLDGLEDWLRERYGAPVGSAPPSAPSSPTMNRHHEPEVGQFFTTQGGQFRAAFRIIAGTTRRPMLGTSQTETKAREVLESARKRYPTQCDTCRGLGALSA